MPQVDHIHGPSSPSVRVRLDLSFIFVRCLRFKSNRKQKHNNNNKKRDFDYTQTKSLKTKQKNEDDERRQGDEPYGRVSKGAPQEGIEKGNHSLLLPSSILSFSFTLLLFLFFLFNPFSRFVNHFSPKQFALI